MEPYLIGITGLAFGLGAHLASRLAERQAARRYRELLEERQAESIPMDEWADFRPLTGAWGCLSIVLVACRAAGLTVALGTVLYLIVQ